MVFQNTVEHFDPCLFLLIQLYIPHRDDIFVEQLISDLIVEHQQPYFRYSSRARPRMTLYGYARVSMREPADKNLDLQVEGDTLVVTHVYRLSRGLTYGFQEIEDLHLRGVEFRFLTEDLDTATTREEMQLTMVPALSEWRRNPIRERSIAGQHKPESTEGVENKGVLKG